jgi:hypothetical protein
MAVGSVVFHVDGVRIYLRTAASNGPIINLQMIYEYGEPRWSDIDRRKPKISEKSLSQLLFVHHKTHVDRPRREHEPPR